METKDIKAELSFMLDNFDEVGDDLPAYLIVRIDRKTKEPTDSILRNTDIEMLAIAIVTLLRGLRSYMPESKFQEIWQVIEENVK